MYSINKRPFTDTLKDIDLIIAESAKNTIFETGFANYACLLTKFVY